jgi:Protein of unknown function (DUF1269)
MAALTCGGSVSLTANLGAGQEEAQDPPVELDDCEGAAMGGLWGLRFGLLFFAPVLGVAVGTAAGALTRSLTDVGIDDGFIRSVREKVTPGTSALFPAHAGRRRGPCRGTVRRCPCRADPDQLVVGIGSQLRGAAWSLCTSPRVRTSTTW